MSPSPPGNATGPVIIGKRDLKLMMQHINFKGTEDETISITVVWWFAICIYDQVPFLTSSGDTGDSNGLASAYHFQSFVFYLLGQSTPTDKRTRVKTIYKPGKTHKHTPTHRDNKRTSRRRGKKHHPHTRTQSSLSSTPSPLWQMKEKKQTIWRLLSSASNS